LSYSPVPDVTPVHYTTPEASLGRSKRGLLGLAVHGVLSAGRAVLLQLHALRVVAPTLLGSVVTTLALGAFQRDHRSCIFLCHRINLYLRKSTGVRKPLTPVSQANKTAYSRILVMTPEPTVRPPSRMAKREPASSATGAISSTVITMLSPGMTISTPSGSVITPVTSVVRK